MSSQEEFDQEIQWKLQQKQKRNLSPPIKRKEVSKKKVKKGVQTGKEPPAKPKLRIIGETFNNGFELPPPEEIKEGNDLLRQSMCGGFPPHIDLTQLERPVEKRPLPPNSFQKIEYNTIAIPYSKPQTAKKSKVVKEVRPPPVKKTSKTTKPKKAIKAGNKKFIRSGEEGYFRHNACKTFITCPQEMGKYTKEQILERIKQFVKREKRELLECIVCRENHGEDEGKGHKDGEDPGRHFHVAMKVNKPWNTINPRYFDEIFGQHVHIESSIDHQAVIVYCAKDGDYVVHNLDVEAIKEAIKGHKGVKHIVVAKDILANPHQPMKEIVEKYPGYMIQHLKKAIEFTTMCQTLNTQTVPYLGFGDYSLLAPQVQQICRWLESNLAPVVRPHKQKQLYIYGPTNIGKTTLLMKLMLSFNTFIVAEEPSAEFWSGFHDDYELAIFDEFNGCKTINQMNSFLEGAPLQLSLKGATTYKRKNIPIIICSNKSPKEVYHKVAEHSPAQMKAFEGRLEIVDCTNFGEEDKLAIPWNEPEIDLEKGMDNLLIEEEEPVFQDPFMKRLNELDEMKATLEQATPPTPRQVTPPLRRNTTWTPEEWKAALTCAEDFEEVNLDSESSDHSDYSLEHFHN